MATFIIRQPKGKFALYSSATDCLVAWNFTEFQLYEHLLSEKRKEISERIRAAKDVPSENAWHCGNWRQAVARTKRKGCFKTKENPARWRTPKAGERIPDGAQCLSESCGEWLPYVRGTHQTIYLGEENKWRFPISS